MYSDQLTVESLDSLSTLYQFQLDLLMLDYLLGHFRLLLKEVYHGPFTVQNCHISSFTLLLGLASNIFQDKIEPSCCV